jgi:hypothetical protein
MKNQLKILKKVRESIFSTYCGAVHDPRFGTPGNLLPIHRATIHSIAAIPLALPA